MPFVLAFLFLNVAHTGILMRALAAHRNRRALPSLACQFVGALAFMCAYAESLGAAPRAGRVSIVGLYLAFGVSTALFALLHLHRLWRRGDKSRFGWCTGMGVWTLLGGVYIAAACADHFWFNRGAQVLVLEPVQAAGSGIACPTPLHVRVDADTARYRCADPSWLGGAIGARFMPWPSYTAGTSDQLKEAVGARRPRAAAGDEQMTVVNLPTKE